LKTHTYPPLVFASRHSYVSPTTLREREREREAAQKEKVTPSIEFAVAQEKRRESLVIADPIH
jgi:hypothetical protein